MGVRWEGRGWRAWISGWEVEEGFKEVMDLS